jgi:hypothetical protein
MTVESGQRRSPSDLSFLESFSFHHELGKLRPCKVGLSAKDTVYLTGQFASFAEEMSLKFFGIH